METTVGTKAPPKGNGKNKGGKLYDVARWDELKKLGWKSEGRDGAWFATHPDYPEKVGPAATTAALITAVKLQVGNKIDLPKDEVEAAAQPEEEPTTRLPGMEEPAIEALDRLGDACIDLKQKRDQAKTAFDDSCDAMRLKMREYGRKRYSRKGMSLVIEDTEKLVIKKAEQAPAKNASTRKKAANA